MLFRVVVLSFLFSLFFCDGYAQSQSMKDIEKRADIKKRLLDKSESKKIKTAREKSEKQKEKYEKAKKDDIKRRFEMQTPNTKKRMKENRKKAEEFNSLVRESFFERLFKRKKPKS